MTPNRKGYTLTEMMVVLVIFGVVTGLSIPRLQSVNSSAAVRSGRMMAAAYLSQARALAVQRGRETRFVRNGNAMSVTVDSSGTQVTYLRSKNLNTVNGLTLSATRDVIAFDARGYAIGLGVTERFTMVRDGMRDSVCVTKMGKVINRGCSL
jgi:prepilin-type N-terminal cleavage/methylation domain-containing protein